MTPNQKEKVIATFYGFALIVTFVWLILEPKIETLLLLISAIITFLTYYIGQKKVELIEERYAKNPEKVFHTSVAFWGPTSSGKTWLLHAFGRALYKTYNKTNGLNYELRTVTGYDFSNPPGDIPGTSGAEIYRYIFERVRTSYLDSKQALSSFKHEINIIDDKGKHLFELEDTTTTKNLLDADIVIIALDPININRNDIPDDHFPSAIQYANRVRKLFNKLENTRTHKKRYYAVCVTKADRLKGGIHRPPEDLIEIYFGEEMMSVLKIPDKNRIKIFTTSSFGFINSGELGFESNFLIDVNGNGKLGDEKLWKPYHVEFPFFWAFEKMEVAALKRSLTKTWWGKITASMNMKRYIRYPEEKFDDFSEFYS